MELFHKKGARQGKVTEKVEGGYDPRKNYAEF